MEKPPQFAPLYDTAYVHIMQIMRVRHEKLEMRKKEVFLYPNRVRKSSCLQNRPLPI